MKLNLMKREPRKKGELGKLRRDGNIPAVLYQTGKEGIPVTVDGSVFRAHLRSMTRGCLATQKFEVELDGKTFSCIVKDITYHRTSYNILHLDFMQVKESDVVTLHVPITTKGEDRCVGISQGGQLKRVKRSVKVSCKVSELPESFILDVAPVVLGGVIRVSDVELQPSMKLRENEKQVLIALSK